MSRENSSDSCVVCGFIMGHDSHCMFHPTRDLEDRIKELKQEIKYLRHFGNKDCTAMADWALQEARRTKQDSLG